MQGNRTELFAPDHLSHKSRSQNMASIRSKDTKPELGAGISRPAAAPDRLPETAGHTAGGHRVVQRSEPPRTGANAALHLPPQRQGVQPPYATGMLVRNLNQLVVRDEPVPFFEKHRQFLARQM
jgi:hypothetical protein